MDQAGGRDWFELRRVLPRWWVLIVVAVVAGGVAAVVSQSVPRATSTATYVLSAAPEIESPFDVSSSLSVLRGREVISTFADILESNTVRELAAAELDDPVTRRYSVEASVLPGSNIVKMAVTGPASGDPQGLASHIGDAATARFTELYPIYRIERLDAASSPIRSAAVTIRNVFIAAVAGTVAAGLILAMVPVQNEGEAEETARLEPVPPLDESENAGQDAEEPPEEEQAATSTWSWHGG